MRLRTKQFLLLAMVVAPTVAMAQADADVTSLYTYVGTLYRNLLFPIGSVLAGFVIMWGGIMYAMSAGDTSKTGRAKELIVGAISGEVLLICAWAIVKIIVT